MRKAENALVTITEECAALQQAVAKALRFGLKNPHLDNTWETNETDILIQYYQLQAVMEMLQQSGFLKTPDDQVIQKIKNARKTGLMDYQTMALSMGLITE